MTSFGWKRKSGVQSKGVASVFTENDDEGRLSRDFDWLASAKKRKVNILEEAKTKSQHLKSEGIALAENQRFFEAVKLWDQAIQLSPKDATLHEMKAQALMQMGEIALAVKEAQIAAKCDPTWWVAKQTLGRAHLGTGQLQMAVRSFCHAVHLNPANEELRKEDLGWAMNLLKEQKMREQKALIENIVKETKEVIQAESSVANTSEL